MLHCWSVDAVDTFSLGQSPDKDEIVAWINNRRHLLSLCEVDSREQWQLAVAEEKLGLVAMQMQMLRFVDAGTSRGPMRYADHRLVDSRWLRCAALLLREG